jgi:hypothetical protein
LEAIARRAAPRRAAPLEPLETMRSRPQAVPAAASTSYPERLREVVRRTPFRKSWRASPHLLHFECVVESVYGEDEHMMVDDLIVLVMLLVFVAVVVGIRLKARTQQRETTSGTAHPSATSRRATSRSRHQGERATSAG